ncbi:MAG: MGMT family protein [Pseudomonadota bacterium]
MKEFSENVRQVVSMIPYGQVATYGQVAELAGFKNYARHVSRVLIQYSEADNLPWHRVVNGKGQISSRGTPGAEEEQRLFLEEEGIEFGLHGTIPLKQYIWNPEDA